jgi:transcriptional regulator of acetoin/glycerol metabolism
MGRHDTDKLIPPHHGAIRQPLGDLPPQRNTTRSEPFPKLRELRNEVFFWAEYNYLSNLVAVCGHNIQRACQVSGLSRSRLYTLLKKYQITTSLHSPCHQK